MTWRVQHTAGKRDWQCDPRRFDTYEDAIEGAKGYRFARVLPPVVRAAKPRRREPQLLPRVDVFRVAFTRDYPPLTGRWQSVQYFTDPDHVERLMMDAAMELGGQLVRCEGEGGDDIYIFTPEVNGRRKPAEFIVAIVARVPLRDIIHETGTFTPRGS